MYGTIGSYNYPGFSLAEKYGWMQQGKGVAAAQAAAEGLGKMAPEFAQSGDNIERGLRQLGLSWQGAAANQAAGHLQRAAAWATSNGQASQVGGSLIERYGVSFAETKKKIPPPVEIGQNSWWGRRADELGAALNETFGSTFGVQSDYAKRVAAYQAADEAANAALKAHEGNAREALHSFPATHPNSPTPTGNAAAVPNAGAGAGLPGGVPPSGGPAGGSGIPGAAPAPGIPAGPGVPGGGGQPDASVPAPAPVPNTTVAAGQSGGPPSAPGFPPPPAPGTNGSASVVPPAAVPIVPGHGGMRAPAPGWTGTGHPEGSPAAERGTGQTSATAPPRGGQRSLELGGRMGPPVTEVGAAANRSAGLAGVPPIAGAGAGLAGQQREHRNQVFIPSDEPFVVADGDDVVPPVLGVSGALR